MVFCSSCGSNLKESFNFCVKCGKPAKDQESVSKNGTASAKSKPILPTLDVFMNKKEADRTSHFKKSKKKKKEKVEEDVSINIGIMRFVEEEGLKPQRGKNLPLKLSRSADSEDILKLAVAKHSVHNSNEVIRASPTCYKLLYGDGTVVDKLKESDEDFTLEKYKAELGKPYSRITLFLCSNSDYFSSSVKGFLEESQSDTDDSDDENAAKYQTETVPPKKKRAVYTDVDTAGGSNYSCTHTDVGTTGGSNYSSTHTDVGTAGGSNYSRTHTDVGTAGGSNYSTLCHTATCSTEKSTPDPHTGTPTGFKALKDIFPHIPDSEIISSLDSSSDVEAAVMKLCDNKKDMSLDQLDSYASVIANNDIEWDSDEYEVVADENNGQQSEHVEDRETICVKLKELSKQRLHSGEIKLKVRRTCVWKDTLVKLKRIRKEDLNGGMVNVHFIGEPAVDQGGPRKEYFFLVHKHMQTSCLFNGPPKRRTFAHNIIALHNEEYYNYGMVSAFSILQGSPGPTMFASSVVDYIVYGKTDAVSAKITELPSGKVRSRLEELDAMDPDTFKQEASFNTPLRFKAGYLKPIVAFEDKDEFNKAICLHHLILSSLPEIEQFICGLKTNGVLHLIRSNPCKSRKLLQFSEIERLTADKVDELFKFIYTPDAGSNKLTSEEAIAFNFTNYLEEVEAGEVTTSILDPDTDEINTVKVQLEHIVQFVTGCPTIPATGFNEQLTVKFDHIETQKKLTANTCSCTLRLPVSKTLTEYASFKTEVTECIFSSPGFGTV